MNYDKSIQLLQLQHLNNSELTHNIVRKQYYKLALIHHPDKQIIKDSHDTFNDIKDAYDYLSCILDDNATNSKMNDSDFVPDYYCDSSNMETDIDKNKDTNTNYSYILQCFLKKYFNGNYNNIIYSIINQIAVKCDNISGKLFDEIDKDKALMIYVFLLKNKDLFYLSASRLEEIKQIILSKYNELKCFKLNPTIDDLFENNVYKLYVDEHLYLVPLWHNELYFDDKTNNTEIIVLCVPDLPPNISIDEHNNIYIDISIDILEICEMFRTNKKLFVDIGKHGFHIELKELYVKQYQSVLKKQIGISKYKLDMYDIKEKADIIINIQITSNE